MDVKEVSGHRGGPVHRESQALTPNSRQPTEEHGLRQRDSSQSLAALGPKEQCFKEQMLTPCTSTGEVVCSVL